MPASFSVIMPAYNVELYIKESIESVLNQSYGHFELIIVNDGSTDCTLEIIKSFDDHRITLIDQCNSGLGRARNVGIKASRNDYIAFLDSDDIWASNKLQNVVDNFEPNIGVYFSSAYKFYLDVKDASVLSYSEPFNGNFSKELILIYDFIVVSSAVVPRFVLDEVGLFDENLHGTEDWDLWIRIGQKFEFKRIFVHDCFYRINPNGLSKNRELFLKKEFMVIENYLLTGRYGSSIVKRRALWVWHRKHLFYGLMNLKLGLAIVSFYRMFVQLPFSPYNFSFVYRAFRFFITKR